MFGEGQSQSGKSQWLYNYIRNLDKLYNPNIKFRQILYCYGEEQALKDIPGDLRKKLTLFPGIPPDLQTQPLAKPAIIVFDDLFTQVFSNKSIVDLFVNSVHHCDITVVLTSQVLFPREPYARTLTLNSQYIVFCPAPRTNSQFGYLATQVCSGDERRALVNAYKTHLENHPTEPFLLDLHPLTPNWARYRSHIFHSGECTIVHCPVKLYNAIKDSPEITAFIGN